MERKQSLVQTIKKIPLFSENIFRVWVSDEYGPYIHLFGSDGSLIRSIQAPEAILPFQNVSGVSKPVLNFTASIDPTTGRAANQGNYSTPLHTMHQPLIMLLQDMKGRFDSSIYSAFGTKLTTFPLKTSLTINPSGTKLFALLQSATIQDGGSTKETEQNTRLLVYDITGSLSLFPPTYVAEYVVPLPQVYIPLN